MGDMNTKAGTNNEEFESCMGQKVYFNPLTEYLSLY